MKLKTSAYHILIFLYRYGFLILTLPLQTFYLKSAGVIFSAYIYLADVLLITSLLICACLSYKHTEAYITQNHLLFRKGVFLRFETSILHRSIHTLRITAGPFQRLFGICRLSAVSSKAQPSIFTKTKTLSSLKVPSKKTSAHIKSSHLSTLLLSVGFYNAFTTTLTLIPLFKKFSTLYASDETLKATAPLSPQSLRNIEEISMLLFTLSAFIITLWLSGIVITFLKYCGLTLIFSKPYIFIRQGLLTKRITRITPSAFSAVLLRQNLLMMILNRYTGEFRIPCEKKENKVAFISAAPVKKCKQILRHLLPISEEETLRLSPIKNSALSYTRLPLILLIIFTFFEITADTFSPYTPATRPALFIFLWLTAWFFFRICIRPKCFISLSDNLVTAGCFFGLTFTLAYIPKDKIRLVKISQSVFQRRKGSCTLRIFVKGRVRKSYFIKHTEKEKAAKFKNELCGRN